MKKRKIKMALITKRWLSFAILGVVLVGLVGCGVADGNGVVILPDELPSEVEPVQGVVEQGTDELVDVDEVGVGEINEADETEGLDEIEIDEGRNNEDEQSEVNSDYEIETIIDAINDRVSWVIENRDSFRTVSNEYFDDYFDNGNIVSRSGYADFDEEGGWFFYVLSYNEDAHLIKASILHYRAPSYVIYFHDDIVIRLHPGDQSYPPTSVLDRHMLDTIAIVLEIAYKNP